MATISTQLRVQPGFGSATTNAATPDSALLRLNLQGQAAKGFTDVVHLSASGLGGVVRTVDAERQDLQNNFGKGQAAVNALDAAGELLTQVRDLVTANAKSGVSRTDRRENQQKIDDLLKQLNDGFRQINADNGDVLDGDTVVRAGRQSLKIDEVSLESLGGAYLDGRSVSVKDVTTRGVLDTAKHRRSTTIAARKSVEAAIDSAAKLKDKISSFLKDSVEPRIGDVATVAEGLFKATSTGELGSSDEATQVAGQIRDLLLSGGAQAVAIGADGWDRDRLVALLQSSASA